METRGPIPHTCPDIDEQQKRNKWALSDIRAVIKYYDEDNAKKCLDEAHDRIDELSDFLEKMRKNNDALRQWGTEMEPLARDAYEFRTDATVETVGFVAHPSILMSGASPDGLVGSDGLVEIKCPNTATHIDTLMGDSIASKYETQMQWQMACTGRKWCDFVSFDPRMPESMRLFIRRVNRDDKRISELELLVCDFLEEIKAKVQQLRCQYEMSEAAQ